ncbi:hypothetical protein ESCO_002774 [Escovopsis weberi]|uniref:Uncharacterized protein n=1 Tax=Escovopsis weberi TaxID=150374 RepID=A0A0M9VSJ2_ESCWE|nr:hypothetical protein ESCO_002774 [Escovopsis weberi]
MSGGWNPITGRDATGQRPSFSPYGAPMPAHGQAYIPHVGGPGYNTFAGTSAAAAAAASSSTAYPRFGTWPGYHQASTAHTMYSLGGQVPVPLCGYPYAAAAATTAAQAFSYQPNGAGSAAARQPGPWPHIDAAMPAAQMTNSTGGTGCEPGYNYFFPAEHTKAHVFKTATPPWQLPPTAHIPFKAAHIPCNTTMAELLKGFGCTNPAPKKNRCFEVVSGGGGKWYKGLEVNGADKDMMKMTIKNVGWDGTRTGNPNEKPVVCLWFCKD